MGLYCCYCISCACVNLSWNLRPIAFLEEPNNTMEGQSWQSKNQHFCGELDKNRHVLKKISFYFAHTVLYV